MRAISLRVVRTPTQLFTQEYITNADFTQVLLELWLTEVS
jgi:hypothetical protein